MQTFVLKDSESLRFISAHILPAHILVLDLSLVVIRNQSGVRVCTELSLPIMETTGVLVKLDQILHGSVGTPFPNGYLLVVKAAPLVPCQQAFLVNVVWL